MFALIIFLCLKEALGIYLESGDDRLLPASVRRVVVRWALGPYHVHPLLHPSTVHAARRAAANCNGPILYTSYYHAGAHPPIVTHRTTNPACVIVFIGSRVMAPNTTAFDRSVFERDRPKASSRARRDDDTAMQFDVPWTYVIHRPAEKDVSAGLSASKMERIPKLLPHLLFPGRTTIYFDIRLQLNAPRDVLAALLESSAAKESAMRSILARDRDHQDHPPSPAARTIAAAPPSLVAFHHPCVGQSGFAPVWCECVGASGCTPWQWMERTSAMASARTAESSAAHLHSHHQLSQQVARYATDPTTPPHAFQTYIDSALLVQRDALDLFEAWSAEYLRPDSAENDELALAYVAAKARVMISTITCADAPTRAGGRVMKTVLCHWYRDASVAKLSSHSSPTGGALSTAAADHNGNATGTVEPAGPSVPIPPAPRPTSQLVACARRWSEADIATFMADHPHRAYLSYVLRLAGLMRGIEVGTGDGRFSGLILEGGRAPDHWMMIEPFPSTTLIERLEGGAGGERARPQHHEGHAGGRETWTARRIGEHTHVLFRRGLSTDSHVLSAVQANSGTCT